jgi:CubicO group peptidase (beta-lactamase class C family)
MGSAPYASHMPSVTARLGPILTKAMKRFSVPGVAVGILLDGEEHRCAKGVTAVDFPLDVDDTTLFQIGSTTKTFTATALMLLVEEGKIDLEAPVRTYLPKFRVPDELTAKSVTVRHLVTHTAGWVGDYFDDLGRGNDALRRIVQRMGKKTPQLTPMDTVWAYNNAGFYVLGRILEEVTGTGYEELVKTRIFDPLGMDRSFFFPEDVMTYKTAIGHQALPDGSVRAARPWGLSRAANPAGGIVSNVVDQLRYARFHLEGGQAADGKRLLKAATVKQMQKPHAPAGSMCDHVGISWLLDRVGGVQIVKHGGSVNGHMSEFLMVPSRRFAITVLTNGSRGHELGKTVLDWALGELIDVHRPEPITRTLTARAAGDYLGRFRNRFGTYVVTAEDGGLLMTTEPDKKLLEADPDLANLLPPPLPVAFVGKDRGVVRGDFVAGSRVEFLRGDEGQVEWLRFGGRLSRRESEASA